MASTSIMADSNANLVPATANVIAPIDSAVQDPTNTTRVFVDHNVTGIGLTPGQTFSVNINVVYLTNSSAFEIWISYDPSIIDVASINKAGGLFTDSTVTAEDCIDGGQNPSGTNCPYNLDTGPGIVNYSLGLFTNTTATSGTLFSITFNVIGTGLSLIHFLKTDIAVAYTCREGQIGCESRVADLPTRSADGYFANKLCYDNRLCTPSVATIRVMSSVLKIGVPITLNATGSYGTNGPRDNITSYSWDWGDGNTIVPRPNPLDTHTYAQPSNYTVTLTIVDSYGATGQFSLVLRVIRFRIDLSVSLQGIIGQVFYPGDQIALRAIVQNTGTNVSTSTFRFLVENRTLQELPLPVIQPNGQTTEIVTWDTTGYVPQFYKLIAEIDPPSGLFNGTWLSVVKGKLVANQTSDNISVVYILLTAPMPPGFGAFLGLNLGETAGVGVLVLAGIIGVASLLRRRRKSALDEAL